jgi:hypothetical protein
METLEQTIEREVLPIWQEHKKELLENDYTFAEFCAEVKLDLNNQDNNCFNNFCLSGNHAKINEKERKNNYATTQL